MAWDGIDLEDKGWMVTMGAGIMEACSVMYLYKTLPLKDWVIYSERCPMPAIIGRTEAPMDSAPWKSLQSAVEQVSNGFSGVISTGQELEKIDFSAEGSLPFAELVNWASRGITTLWRGGDLSTMSNQSAEAGQGASVQGEEKDTLTDDDCQMVSETCNLQLDRLVLDIVFGEGTEALAYFSYGGAGRVNITGELATDQALYNMGAPLSMTGTLERYGRPVPKPGEELLQKPAGGQSGLGLDMGEREKENEPDFGTQTFAQSLEAGDSTTRHMIKAARKRLANSQAKALAPIRSKIERLVSIGNEQDFQRELVDFRRDLPSLLLKINESPTTQRDFEALITASVLNGMAESMKQAPKTV